MKYLKILCTVALCLTAISGDFVVFVSLENGNEVLKALSDILVHGAVGFWSSIVFFCYETRISVYSRVILIIICTFVAMIIDIDHVMKTGSFKIKEILSEKERGIFHNTSLTLLITYVLLVHGVVWKKESSTLIGCMVLLGSLTHQLRDGNRRGLWFHPIASTNPLDTKLYILLLALLSNLTGLFYSGPQFKLYKLSKKYTQKAT